MSIKETYTRISTIVNPWNQYKDIPLHILEAAAERGTRVHDMIAASLHGFDPLYIPEDLKGYMDSFYQLPGFEGSLEIEQRFYCDKAMITGCIDLLYIDELENVHLIDFKTSAKENKSWGLQLAGYRYLLKESGKDVNFSKVVMLKKDGKEADILLYNNVEYYDNLFLKALELYHHFYKKEA